MENLKQPKLLQLAIEAELLRKQKEAEDEAHNKLIMESENAEHLKIFEASFSDYIEMIKEAGITYSVSTDGERRIVFQKGSEVLLFDFYSYNRYRFDSRHAYDEWNRSKIIPFLVKWTFEQEFLEATTEATIHTEEGSFSGTVEEVFTRFAEEVNNDVTTRQQQDLIAFTELEGLLVGGWMISDPTKTKCIYMDSEDNVVLEDEGNILTKNSLSDAITDVSKGWF